MVTQPMFAYKSVDSHKSPKMWFVANYRLTVTSVFVVSSRWLWEGAGAGKQLSWLARDIFETGPSLGLERWLSSYGCAVLSEDPH